MYVNQAFSPVLVVLRSQPPLMPDRRRITIRWQSGGGPCTFPSHVAVDHSPGTAFRLTAEEQAGDRPVGPYGRRMRSASPNLDSPSARMGSAPIRKAKSKICPNQSPRTARGCRTSQSPYSDRTQISSPSRHFATRNSEWLSLSNKAAITRDQKVRLAGNDSSGRHSLCILSVPRGHSRFAKVRCAP